jgi:hypothetical protein
MFYKVYWHFWVEETQTQRKPPTCRKSLTNFITCCIEYTSPWARFELTSLVVIGNDFIGRNIKEIEKPHPLQSLPCLSLETTNILQIILFIISECIFEYEFCWIIYMCIKWILMLINFDNFHGFKMAS